MSERDPADRTRTLVIDIGGGSTELVIGEGREVRFHVSTQAGVVRQTERHLHWDPPTDAELDALCADVRAIISRAVPSRRRRSVQHAIAVAGTATQLAAIAQALVPYDPDARSRLRDHERRAGPAARAACRGAAGRAPADPGTRPRARADDRRRRGDPRP